MEFKRKQTTRSPISDEQIVALYWMRDEKAIAETDSKYKNYLLSIAYNIVHNELDCEECLADTYLAVWNAIPPSKPNMLKAFLTTIMRRIAINRYHNKSRKGTIPSEMTVSLTELEEFLSSDQNVSNEFDARELGRVISEFVRNLSKRRQIIFMSRYYMAEPIDAIARELDLSRSMINKELSAIRKTLKEKLESEGYSI